MYEIQAAQKSRSNASRFSDFQSRRSTQPLRPPRYPTGNDDEKTSGNGINRIDEEEIVSPLMTSTNTNNNNNNGNNQVGFVDRLEIIEDSDTSMQPLNRIDEAERTKSFMNLLRYTVENEGVGGLYQGLGPKLLHATLLYSFIFALTVVFNWI